MGRALSTVGDKAKKMGLSFDRTQMEAAIKASQIDRRALRAEATALMWEEIRETSYHLQKVRLGQEAHKTLLNDRGSQLEAELNFIPPSDLRFITQSLLQLSTAASNMEKLDADGGLEQARGMLGRLFEAIAASVEGLEPLNPVGVAK